MSINQAKDSIVVSNFATNTMWIEESYSLHKHFLTNTRELYNHVNSILVHAKQIPSGSYMITSEDYEALKETTRRFQLYNNSPK